jgi:paraquat-inducible protein A
VSQANLIACQDCDLLNWIGQVPPGGVARCQRCRAVLQTHKRNSVNRTLAFASAGLILFVVANSFPFLDFRMQGQATQTTLITGVKDLYAQGMVLLSLLVLVTTILVPALQLLLMLYVLAPLKLDRSPWGFAQALRLLKHTMPWSMLEVFMLGILVAVVKLADMATIVPGLALWSFALLIFALAAMTASFDAEVVWERVQWSTPDNAQ